MFEAGFSILDDLHLQIRLNVIEDRESKIEYLADTI